MMAAAICRRLRPNRHRRLLSQSPTPSRQFSSSNSDDNHENGTPPSPSQSQSSSSMSSYFNDFEASLRKTPPPHSPPRRPWLLDSNPTADDAQEEEFRKHLSQFFRSSVKPPTSSPPTMSSQELYKRMVPPQADLGSSSEDSSETAPFFINTIRMSLKNQRTSSSQSQQPEISDITSQNKNDRVWTHLEETKLVEALVAMVNTGAFKSDNGFKSGYLAYLEQALKESLPSSGILGKPHIESKLKIMKKDWTIVHDMLSGSHTSGFRYDGEKHCVVAEDQVWESYLQVHKGAGKWKNKVFPFYEDLCIAFGKDRAQGKRARDFVEIEEEVNREDQEQHMYEEFDDVTTTSHIQGVNANMHSEETSSGCGRKRKRRVDPMADGFSNAVTKLGEILEKMANKFNKGIEREEELDKKRSSITSEISKMRSFTQSQKFKVISMIRGDTERVNMFWDLQEADRESFVKWVLGE